MNLENEIWKPVVGYANGFYDGLYEISNKGRFKQLARRLNCRGGSRVSKEKIVVGTDSYGYRTVAMKKDKIRVQIGVHILVAKAFLDNPENKYSVNHIDTNRSNNSVENLEWATQKEQIDHAIRLGRMKWEKGTERKNSKLTESDVLEIRRLYIKTNTTFRKLSAQFNVSPSTIKSILDYKKWKHVASATKLITKNKMYEA